MGRDLGARVLKGNDIGIGGGQIRCLRRSEFAACAANKTEAGGFPAGYLRTDRY